MITIVAKMRAEAGKEDELRAVLTGMVEQVAAHEPGVTAYLLHVSDDDPTLFLFYEQYASTEAQGAHRDTDHVRALGGKLQGLLGGRPEISRLTQIAGIDR